MRIFRCRQIIIGGSSEIERRMIGMMTVKQMSSLTGVSVRTLQFYDEIGLLKPAQVTEAGYRMYDENACLLYTSPSPRDRQKSRMPSSA